jgi:hypothetical protein
MQAESSLFRSMAAQGQVAQALALGDRLADLKPNAVAESKTEMRHTPFSSRATEGYGRSLMRCVSLVERIGPRAAHPLVQSCRSCGHDSDLCLCVWPRAVLLCVCEQHAVQHRPIHQPR